MTASQSYNVRHRTLYAYSGDVVHSHQLLHLAPRESARQTRSAHDIAIQPAPTHSTTSVDAFGNPVLRLEFDRPHQLLDVTAQMSVTVRRVSP
ncbi:MAG TPA: transglutaminase N-terminal domain-containing protein, partial [Povalibacter sp.]|nr:transglutaminase N-terminal domain-containing protein [Povalibacter sp.]